MSIHLSLSPVDVCVCVCIKNHHGFLSFSLPAMYNAEKSSFRHVGDCERFTGFSSMDMAPGRTRSGFFGAGGVLGISTAFDGGVKNPG